MEAVSLASNSAHPTVIDICWPCHVIWFDHLESASLAPQAVIDLFKAIHAHRDSPHTTPSGKSQCPTCQSALQHSFDFSRGGRFAYHRCPHSHGRLISFVNFLREKQFVRTLAPHERATLAASVRQVRCASCGAGVDIAKDDACTHCGAPISVLDERAVARALAELQSRAEAPSHRALTNVPPAYEALKGGTTFTPPPRLDGGGDSLVSDVLMAGIALVINGLMD
jgi:hypothetical protein